jgi:AcrR family transcriptional regulator
MPKVSEAHLEARRQQILSGAMACFAREGFHRATMQDIVGEAGLSAGAIYRYFAGKEEIVEVITDERHEREREVLKAAATADDPADALRLLIEAFVGDLTRDDGRAERRVRVQIYAEAVRNSRIRRVVRRGVDRPREVLAEIVRTAQARGRLGQALDADALARLMLAIFHGLVLQQVWDEKADLRPCVDALESMLDVMLDEFGAERQS